MLAAGAPWFMTVFGRDSLITSWMALLVDPDLALGVLQTLARFQGKNIDPRSEEQPGRILHEMRFGDAPSLSLGGGSIYYGTADATPLFVMLLGELRRWGLAREVVDELLPNAERALEWIENYGDLDGDGYVEYQRMTDRGLANQGWKDSARRHPLRATGRVAHAPIALCEVQAYVYSAYLARAHFAREAGDEATFERFRAKATKLKTDFNRDFWLEEHGWFAVGLDADKRPIDSLTSNIGHCLWTGIVDQDKARVVADKLMAPDMNSGWGIRTLAIVDGRLQPHQLPLRVGVAARHRHRGGRAGPVRVHGRGTAARRARCSTRRHRPRWSAPGAVLRAGPLRVLVAGRLSHVVLAPGLGGGIAAAVPAHHAAPRPMGPLRQDLAVADAARGHEAPEGGGDPAGGIARHRRGRRRRRRGDRAAPRGGAHHRAAPPRHRRLTPGAVSAGGQARAGAASTGPSGACGTWFWALPSGTTLSTGCVVCVVGGADRVIGTPGHHLHRRRCPPPAPRSSRSRRRTPAR